LLTNKHVLTALIVAPILALVSYYLVDLWVKEQPHKAVTGQSYQLVAQSNCRYTSGLCVLENGTFKVSLVVRQRDQTSILVLDASHRLDKVKIGLSSDSTSITEPISMVVQNTDRTKWEVELLTSINKHTALMLAVLARGSYYYAETTMEFAEYKTIFNNKFEER